VIVSLHVYSSYHSIHLGHPLKCGIYSIFYILNKSFNGCPWDYILVFRDCSVTGTGVLGAETTRFKRSAGVGPSTHWPTYQKSRSDNLNRHATHNQSRAFFVSTVRVSYLNRDGYGTKNLQKRLQYSFGASVVVRGQVSCSHGEKKLEKT
jgi:hypothetical protein